MMGLSKGTSPNHIKGGALIMKFKQIDGQNLLNHCFHNTSPVLICCLNIFDA
jgi:hypothetical protein